MSDTSRTSKTVTPSEIRLAVEWLAANANGVSLVDWETRSQTLLTAADQIEAMASVGIRQEREVERLRAVLERIDAHLEIRPGREEFGDLQVRAGFGNSGGFWLAIKAAREALSGSSPVETQPAASNEESTDIVTENVETALQEIAEFGYCDLTRGDVIWLMQILSERSAHETTDRIGPREPDNDMVICPNCTSQFRAIPVNVQKQLSCEPAQPPDSRPFIGDVRRALFRNETGPWNGYVRDITAQMELRGWLSSSPEEPRETTTVPALPMRMNEPWSLPEVLAKLIEATEHSLNVHSCDTHGHELFRAAANAGRSILREWQSTAVEPTPALLDRKVTVCAACLCACCWQGDFYCDKAKSAGTVEKTIRELLQGNLREDSGYWFKDPNTGQVDYDAKSAAKRAWLAEKASAPPTGARP